MAFSFGQALQGSVGGAIGGAALGGPLGGVAGGLLGGLFGGVSGDPKQNINLPGFEERQRLLQQQIAQFSGPSIQNFQQASNGGQFRDSQLKLISQLQDAAAGKGPSIAQQQFDRNLGQGVNAQVAQASTGRSQGALSSRNAAQNIGSLTQDLAGKAALARLQEQLAARGQLGAVVGQGRGQELQSSQFNAEQENRRRLELARQQMLHNQYLRQLELRNAQAQQGSLLARNQGPGVGTQLLNAGGSVAAFKSGLA